MKLKDRMIRKLKQEIQCGEIILIVIILLLIIWVLIK